MSCDFVSVIIPTFNRPHFIRQAIDSCFAQEEVRVQVIVVDDNGIGTKMQQLVEEIVHPFMSRHNFKYLVHETTKNGSAARNTGIKAAEGEYVAFLDDDDWFEPLKLYKQVQSMRDEGSAASLVGFRRVYDNCSVEGYPVFNDPSFDLLRVRVDTCAGSGLVVKRDLATEMNGFDESFIRLQDIEFLYRISKLTKISVVPEVLLNVRMHNGNIGKKTYEKDVTSIEHFLKVFADDIEALPSNKRREVYNNQYVEIAKGMIKHKKYFRAINMLCHTPNPIKNFRRVARAAWVFARKKS